MGGVSRQPRWFWGCSLGLLALGIGVLMAPLLALFPMIFWESYEPYALGVSLGLFAVGYTLLGMLVGGIYGGLIRWRARRFDEIFAPLGWRGRSYLLSGRRYRGTFQGRSVVLSYATRPLIYRRAFRRMMLDRVHEITLRVAAAPRQHFEVAAPADAPPDLPSPAREALARLLPSAPNARWVVQSQPDAMVLHITLHRASDVLGPYCLTAENVRRWARDLIAVARALEAFAPPDIAAPVAAEATLGRTLGANLAMVLFLVSILATWFCLGMALIGALLTTWMF